MGLGRRKIRVDDASSWIFNRMVDYYVARPAYPATLIDAIAALASTAGARVGDLGAGVGHLALPLAARGFDVVAIEPAQAMLDRLRGAALARGLTLRTVHAAAEALPLESARLDLVTVVDALHFLDKELAANEVARVLAPRGALALVTSALADTPFMRGVVQAMEEAAPRRPRNVSEAFAQFSTVTRVPLTSERQFHDEVPVDRETLERILRSITFIGPAMNPQRFEAFRQRIHALPQKAVWARTFTLRSGRRPGKRSVPMLELRPTCEHCNKPLPPESTQAMICSFECTFCSDCVASVTGDVCPNCGGGFSPRPVRPSRNHKGDNYLGKFPARTEAKHHPVDRQAHERFATSLAGVPPERR